MSDKILAFISSKCPFCAAQRCWPGSFYGRAMARLQRFCPFCRAYARLYPLRVKTDVIKKDL